MEGYLQHGQFRNLPTGGGRAGGALGGGAMAAEQRTHALLK